MSADPITLLVASAIIGAGGTVYQGVEARKAADTQAQWEEIAAAQQHLENTRNLKYAMAANRNLFAARGQAMGGTAATIQNVAMKYGMGRINTSYQVALANARATRRRGKSAQTASLFSAAGQGLGGYGRWEYERQRK